MVRRPWAARLRIARRLGADVGARQHATDATQQCGDGRALVGILVVYLNWLIEGLTDLLLVVYEKGRRRAHRIFDVDLAIIHAPRVDLRAARCDMRAFRLFSSAYAQTLGPQPGENDGQGARHTPGLALY
mmetsp:Transcript_27045/g.81878  ORF Transcript_27045/g.81878 Transcript_27045/m.81878 type:complete len:130 (+) Transcript_27045:1818-2207(+)